MENEEAQQIIKWARENWRIGLYSPNGTGKQFIDLIKAQSSLVNVFSAANGVGKTALAVNIIGNLVFGPQSEYFDDKLFKNWPFPKRVRYVTDPELVKEIGPFHTEITKWWPKDRYEAYKSGKQYFSEYKANGWIVDVMTYEQDVRQFEGGNMGLIVMDEPPPKSIWHACVTRLRLGGIIMVMMTPLTSAAWFFDEVVPRHQQHIIYATVESACKEHGKNGHLDHAQIERMIAEMDPTEIEARAYGRAMYLSGLIFKNFDPTVHVAKRPIDVPVGSSMWHIVDPHIDKPFAMIWGYPGKDGVFHQIAEWPNEEFSRMRSCNLGLDDYKRIIKAKELGWNVTRRIIDRHFAETRSLYTNRTLREDLRSIGFNFEPSYTAQEEVETGILKIRSALNWNPIKPLDTVNKPKYIVSPTCVNTIKSFQRWAFDPKTGKIQEDYKDFMDCVRYALCDRPKVSKSLPPQEYKKLYG